LSIDGSTGVVSGTPPTGTKTFTYSVTASNVVGTVTAGPFAVPVTTPPPASTKADISVALSCPASGKMNVAATCTLTVRNAGPAAAKPVWATLALPSTLGLVSSAGGGTTWHNIVTWKTATLAANGSQVFTVTFKPRTAGKALIGAAAVSGNPDPSWRNNVAVASLTLTR
jgi:hypothetical protein